MSKEEVREIFFELLTKDRIFQRKLTKFIWKAVAKKFNKRLAKDKPEEIPNAAPEPEKKSSTEEFAENVAKLMDERDKLNGQLHDKQKSIDELNGQLRDKQNSIDALNGQLRDKQNSIDALNGQLRDKQNSIDTLNGQLRDKQNSIDTLNGQLRDKQNSIDTLNGQLRDKQNSIDALNGQLRDKQNSIDALNGQLRDKQNSIDALNGQLRDKQNSIDALNGQLEERFSEGWELYQKFLRIDSATRQNSSLYTEDFVSFICSGAQMKRLENIWDAALDSKRERNFDEAEIFWEVFNYCVRLVNAAQGDKVIELLNTQIGEGYSSDKHSTGGTDSAAQGVVREIILAGYRNNISKKIVRKSNVRVG